MCASFADCLEGVLEGDRAWAVLAEAFPTLVLHGIPYGISNVVELEQRLAAWEAGDLSGLVTRIQHQEAGREKDARALTEGAKRNLAGARARRLAKEGARSKAVGSLRGGIKNSNPGTATGLGAKAFAQVRGSITDTTGSTGAGRGRGGRRRGGGSRRGAAQPFKGHSFCTDGSGGTDRV